MNHPNLDAMSDVALQAYTGSLAQQVADLVVAGGTFDAYDRSTIDRYRAARDVLMDRFLTGEACS